MHPAGLILVGIGLFTLCGSAFDWEFFMNARKARFFVGLFGRTGARIFYGALSIMLIAFGILVTMGVIEPSK